MTADPGGMVRRAALLAALALLVLAPGLDGPFLVFVRGLGTTAWGSAWAGAAHYLGLGGIQAGLMLLVALVAWRRGYRGALGTALTGAGAVALAGLLANLVKYAMGRPRPRLALPPLQLSGPTLESDFNSFPSGHATTSFALAAVLAWRYPRLAWLFYGLAAAVAYGRMLGGAHYLSDVLGGAVVGLLVGLPLGVWAERRDRRSVR